MKLNYSSVTKAVAKIAFGLALLSSHQSHSQAAFYGFSENSGTYTELTNPTIIASATANTAAGSMDSGKFPVAIPFSFPFSGNTFTNLTIHTDGFISFGATSPNGTTPISNITTPFDGAVAALATDLNSMFNVDGNTGSISTKLEGTSLSQEFVIQWKNFRPYSISANAATYFNWNFQIRLKQDGSIKIVYDLKVKGTPTSTTAQVGIRGVSAEDYNNRYAGGTTTSNWMSTTPGSGNTSVIFCNSTSLPTAGYTFNWTPPSPCVAPTSQPTALTFTVDGVIITGNFTAANPVSDKYLIIRTPQGTNPNIPVNGTNYTVGESTALNGKIVYVGQNTTFTDNALSGIIGNTNYTYTVFSVSSSCTGGPLYNTTSPLTANVTSCPGPPNQLTASNLTSNSFLLNWNANNGSALPFTYSLQIATDASFVNQITGSPFTIAATETTYNANGLLANTKYYYRIKAESNCTGINSSSGNSTTLCNPVSVLNEPFTGFTTANLVPCWTLTGWEISSVRGAVGLNGAENIHRNLFSSTTSGTFTTVTVGPIAANSEFSFDYKQSNYNSPYAPLTTWGNYNVQISTNSGATWTTIATIDNEAGTGSYIHKTFSLSEYAGNLVTFKINATRTAGDFDLSFDNFKVEETAVVEDPVASVNLTTQADVASQITTNAGTLQLLATILPATANQSVTWSIVSGENFASINQTGLVTATANGTVIVRATSTVDTSKFGEITIAISNQGNTGFPSPYCNIDIEDSDPDYIEPITFVSFSNISNTSSAAVGGTPVLENFTSIIGNVVLGQTYPLIIKGNTNGNFETNTIRIYFDWNQNGTFEATEGYAVGTIYGSNGTDEVSATANITIPQTALIGNTRMRIVKDYEEDNTDACNDIYFGQAEDYTLNIQENLGTGDFNATKFVAHPNPTSSFVNIQTDLEIENIAVYNQVGQLISNQKNTQVDLSNVASGIYLLHIDFENGQKAVQKIIKK